MPAKDTRAARLLLAIGLKGLEVLVFLALQRSRPDLRNGMVRYGCDTFEVDHRQITLAARER